MRTGSPDRARSPARVLRSLSPMRGELQSAIDVDPEAVRMALRDFVNQLANSERERVSFQFGSNILVSVYCFVNFKMNKYSKKLKNNVNFSLQRFLVYTFHRHEKGFKHHCC